MYIIFFLGILFVVSDLFAQAPQTLWTRTYGGSEFDDGYSIVETADGGFMVIGSTSSFGAGSFDIRLIRIDASGDTLWTRTYGGTEDEFGLHVLQTSEEGFIVAGYTKSFGAGSQDVWLIRTDASGDTLWTRTYGGSNRDEAHSIQQMPDGGFIVAGFTESFGAGSQDVWLIRTDASGDILWTRTYGGAEDDFGLNVQQTSDGGFIVAGGTESFGAGLFDNFLIRTDASGDTLWTRTYGGSAYDAGKYVLQTPDGGFIVTGNTFSFGAGSSDNWLIRTDASGEILWTQTYGGSARDVGESVLQTPDGGFIVAGNTKSFGAGSSDIWLIRTDASGDTLWTQTYGGSDDEHFCSITVTSDGGFIVSGLTDSFGAGSFDAYLIRVAPELVSVEEGSSVIPKDFTLYQNYPNPFNPTTTIEYSLPKSGDVSLIIYNIVGQEVARLAEGVQQSGNHSVTWNVSNLVSGIYFYRLQAGEFVQTRKMVLLK